MNSPFPGMDPYLEDPAFWRDFHHTFIGCWREAIADVLPERYEARVDETIQYVQMPEDIVKVLFPDVAVNRKHKRPRQTPERAGGTATLTPAIIAHQLVDEVRQGRIEVRHRADRSIVTVLELLSPTNKTGDGFAEFCVKRQTIIGHYSHLVELDLLLGGQRMPLSEPLPSADYYLLLSRANKRPNCEVYAWSLREPLPMVPVPLRAPDPDVHVDLQAVFRQTYERGRYAPSLRYGKAPQAPVPAKDRRWVMAQKRK